MKTSMSPATEHSQKHGQRSGPKERRENLLTKTLRAVEVNHLEQWSLLEDLDVTCGTFKDASMDWPGI